MRFRNDYYQILGVRPSADFAELKRAYYRRAKECHPDRHSGCLRKEEEFKLLVEAFNVLSDPVRRKQFDDILAATTSAPRGKHVHVRDSGRRSILDSLADDELEELIVDNNIPENATLQTLMLDLERTERFCLFREAKTCYYKGRLTRARTLLDRAVHLSPNNILYRYFLGRTLSKLGRYRKAIRQFKVALHIGMCRIPPLRLTRIRRDMMVLQEAHGGLVYRLLKPFRPPVAGSLVSADEDMRDQLERCMARAGRKKKRAARSGSSTPALPSKRKQLMPRRNPSRPKK